MEAQATSGITPNRTCGGCSACCKTHAVPTLKKVAGSWCKHFQVGKGCSIYADRPSECQTYSCTWLQGFGNEEQRPDRLKVVIDSTAIEVDGKEILFFNLWEIVEGAIDRPRVKQVLLSFLAAGLIVAYRRLGGEATYFFPDALQLSPEDKARLMAAAEGGKKFAIVSKLNFVKP